MTGYMAEMRKLVGHKTIIQCAASIICVDENGRVLLGKRSDNHMWGYSGGAIEIDEYVEECAKRELFEEMGLVAEELEFFCVNSGPKSQDGEMEDLRFLSVSEIVLSEISPPIRSVVENYISQAHV